MNKHTQLIAPPGSYEMRITRTFNAPVELVFKTWIDPKLIPQWWGPAYLATTVERMEPRDGGSYRIVQRAPDGKVHGFRGAYHTVSAPHLIISTFEYDGFPDHVSLDTYSFEKRGNKTNLTIHSVFQSVADRDAMVQSGCEAGVVEMMERMDILLLQQR